MEPKTKLALSILAVAFVMGVLADALLRGVQLGINVPLWIFCLLIGLFAANGVGNGTLRFGSIPPLAPMAIFGICFAWRDSTTLQALDLGAIVVAAALVLTRQSAPFWTPTLGRIFQSVLNLAGHCAAGFIHLVTRDIDWAQQRNATVAANLRGAGVGILIAAPLLAIFTVLFIRADAAFEKLFQDFLSLRFASHIFPIGVGAWVAGSYLRGVLVPAREVSTANSRQRGIGSVEINVALALLNALFAAFVAVQAQYLFGGAALIANTPGLTLSAYARRGFFELVTVALLVLPILLSADKWHAADKPKRAFRIQSLLMVAFVICVMVSAMHRMHLYRSEFGQTELRWYTTAFMVWLTFIFALFCVTVLREARELFVITATASAFVALLALHALNPDQRIAAANLSNARAGRRFDPDYLRKLSADAVPVVIRNFDVVPDLDRKAFLDHHAARLLEARDWRAWNHGRDTAITALRKAGR
jgi:hypothetical protein